MLPLQRKQERVEFALARQQAEAELAEERSEMNRWVSDGDGDTDDEFEKGKKEAEKDLSKKIDPPKTGTKINLRKRKRV